MQARMISRVLMVLILAFLAAPALADDVESGSPGGGELVPLDSQAIRMVRERVDVFVHWPRLNPNGEPEEGSDGHAEARVIGQFVLANESDRPQSIQVAFPGDYGVWGFTRSVDGHPVEVVEHPSKSGEGRFGNASRIEFGPGQVRHIRVSYEGRFDTSGSYSCSGAWAYILTTGARWKGKIDEAVVAVHFPKDMPPGGIGPFAFGAVKLGPKGYTTKGRTATWVFRNFEPAKDITVMWDNRNALYASNPLRLAPREEAPRLQLQLGMTLTPMAPKRALKAFADLRKAFPDSPEARTLDYHVARAYWQHWDFANLSRYMGPSPRKAVIHYEKALKEPLAAEERQVALVELFLLYSRERADPAQAGRILGLLKEERICLDEHGDFLYAVGSVSPQAGLDLLGSMIIKDERETDVAARRREFQRLIDAEGDGPAAHDKQGPT